MISARVSPMVELARWLFERAGLPYAEEPHAPVLHILATRLAGGGNEIPVVVSPEGVWSGGAAVVYALDAKSPPGARLLGDSAAAQAQQRAIVDTLFSHLLKPVRRFVYWHLLSHRALVIPIVTDGAPWWERAFVSALYPIWRWLMGKALDFSPDLLKAAPQDIRAAFDFVEAHLTPGKRFLGGDAPDTIDIVFSALTAPVIFPLEYGARLPSLEQVPAALRHFIEELRARRGGRLVLDTYASARGTPQPRLPFCRSPRSWIPSSMTVGLANAWRRLAPRFAWRKLLVISRWDDVTAVLADDICFTIAPINATRIDEVSGPFILGMDRGRRLLDERRALYSAMAAVDLARCLLIVRDEADRLLDAACAGSGQVDVVNGYARLIAARTAVALFGVRGPTEQDLMRVVRRIFQHTFLNTANDANVRALAIDAGVELAAWVNAEMARRRGLGLTGMDLLGRLMADAPGNGLDDDGIRRNFGGVLVGAIDTTATAVTNIMVELCSRPAQMARLLAGNVHDERWVGGWCWEMLRRRPHNPALLRSAVSSATLGGKPIVPGTTILLVTLAAMHDPAAFDRPQEFDPARPVSRYLHFGAGVHLCAGRNVNALQIPALVAALVARRPMAAGSLRVSGPFPDEFVVSLPRTNA
jgi:cytochrome P450